MARTKKIPHSHGLRKSSGKARGIKTVVNKQYNIVHIPKTDEELVLAINSVGSMLRKSKCIIITKKMRKKIPSLI